jgi:5-formyltetrahydrofolate cyclo-ligase
MGRNVRLLERRERTSSPAAPVNPGRNVADEKAALRERFAQVRLALSEEEYYTASKAICERLSTVPEIASAGTISVYWPLLVRREVDTRTFIERLVGEGRRVVLPVVLDFQSAPEMGHVAYAGESKLRPNRWGLLEPVGDPVPAGQIEACVVPALGAGRNLHRIGYGRGFYDAFLKSVTVPAAAIVFSGCLIDHVPQESHDVALTAVLTEHETVRDGS